MSSFIAQNLLRIRQEINQACVQAGRSPPEVTLLAVSKGHDFAAIKAAYGAGQRDFGESYATEMVHKITTAHALGIKDINWHFIGAIQSNKIKLIKKADIIHSVSSLKQAEVIDKNADKITAVFLQINLDENPSRLGFKAAELLQHLAHLKTLSKLNIQGLMAILPIDSEQPQDFWFMSIVRLQKELIEQKLLSEVKLSMGMSDDFVRAIAYGSHVVRIGSAIFGPRSFTRG